ncbi:MAG: pentapeptide repeat-containing protein [Kineosporiaceae bacterium]
MPRRAPRTKLEPDPPELPADLAPAPVAVRSGDHVDGVVLGPGVDLPGHLADLRLDGCRWVGAELRGRRLTGLRAQDVHIDRCDLSGAVLEDAELRRVVLIGCRLSGTSFSGADLTDVRIVDCRADLSLFRMATASHLLAEGSSLRGADFYEMDGSGCAFLGCDLTEADVSGARLRGLRLHGSDIRGVLGAHRLRGAEISADQVPALGEALLADLGVRITDGGSAT